jgi:thymidylate kinase
MHIAIEGLDGVGKTTTAKKLAEKLGFRFIEKPMRVLTDPDGGFDHYLRATDWLNSEGGNTLKVFFYGCGNVLTAMQARGENIVTDRHLASNYYWNGDSENESLFLPLIKESGVPDLTVILYASPDIRRQRIIARNPEDKDIARLGSMPADAYDKMKYFVEKYAMPYIFVDNSNIDMEQTVAVIAAEVEKIRSV